MSKVSTNLDRFCSESRLSIKDLSLKSGISVRTIERIKTGYHIPDMYTLVRLAGTLNKDPLDFFQGTDDRLNKLVEVFESNQAERRKREKQLIVMSAVFITLSVVSALALTYLVYESLR